MYEATSDGATATLTNIGNVQLREPYNRYVEHFYAMLAMSRGQNIKGAVVSCNGTLIITFTTCLTDVSVQKRFFRLISGDGVQVAVETNDTDDLYDADDQEPSGDSSDADRQADTEEADEQMS